MWDLWQGEKTSYGLVSRWMLEALHALGVSISTVDGPPGAQMDPALAKLVSSSQPMPRWGVRHGALFSPSRMPNELQARYTVWHWQRLPKRWVETINAQDGLVAVPAQQQKEIFVASGVTVPVAVVAHGVRQDVFRPKPPPRSRWFTFGTHGYITYRKGIEVLVRAFADEFRNEDDVRLIVKTSLDPEAGPTHGKWLRVAQELGLKEPKLIVKTGRVPQAELLSILGSFDVGVFPSRAEGFGMCGLECMSVGRTVICTRWGGMADYLRADVNFGLDYTIVPDTFAAKTTPRSMHGPDFDPHWAEPSYEHLRSLLRYCYEHRSEVRAKGRAASKWAAEHWTWKRAAQQLVDAIDGLP